MIKITHIITGLNQGGAEKTLLRLVKRMKASNNFDIRVISLLSAGHLEKEYIEAGIPLICLNMNKKNFLSKLFALYKLLRMQKPEIVQTWMYHANLLGGLAAKLNKIEKVYWNVRCSSYNLKLLTKLICSFSAILSYIVPKKIIYCGEEAEKSHRAFLYCQQKSLVIPNGFDLGKFYPVTQEKRIEARKKLGIQPDDFVFGKVARFNYLKRYDRLLEAFSQILNSHPAAKLILCGRGISLENTELARWILSLGIPKNNLILINGVLDPAIVYHALDVLVLSSSAEGFSNVIGEAMASGIPCISTDVGDNKKMIADTGIVVSANAQDLAQAMRATLNTSLEQRMHMGLKARERIETYYSLDSMFENYQALYQN